MDFAYLHIASLLFALCFVVLLFSKRGKQLGDYLLILFLLLLSVNNATMFLVAKDIQGFRWLIEISDASVFIYGPLLWWYTLAFTEVDFRFKAEYWGHAFPFIMALVILEVPVLGEGGAVPEYMRHTLLGLKMLSILVYCLLILQSLRSYQRRLKQYFSTTDRLQLQWMYFLCLSILFVWGISVVSLGLFFGFEVRIPLHGGLYSNVAVSIFVFVMGIYGFRQTAVFAPAYQFRHVWLEDDTIEETEQQADAIKYKNSGLDDTAALSLLTKLETYMRQERPYLDQELTLFKLAEGVGSSPNHLSQTINSLRGQNFFDFVNQYRVEAVKQRLDEPETQKLTLLGLAMEAGFKSKASFNRSFRKFTGMTPTEFKNSLS